MTIDTSREAVERLLDGVTEGPWRVGSWGDNVFGTGPKDEWLPICRIKRDDAPIEDTIDARDARFIAAARELVPALLARAEAAEAREQALLTSYDEERKALVENASLRERLKAALAERDAALAEVARLSTPPDALALVAAAYRDAAGLPAFDCTGDPCGTFDGKVFVKLDAILARTPADAQAALTAIERAAWVRGVRDAAGLFDGSIQLHHDKSRILALLTQEGR